MKTYLTLMSLALCIAPAAVIAAPASSSTTVYKCSTCHMKFSAAQAKADHYKDPMDGGILVKAAPAKTVGKKAAKPSSSSMAGMKM